VRRVPALALLSALAACKLATVRPLDSKGAPASRAGSFDATAYVASIWSARVVATVEREATECAHALASLASDRDGTLRRLGRGPRGPAYLLVKCEGVVVAVQRRSRAGLLGVDVAPRDGQADLWVQIGPVVPGMALRDAVGFISFDQFLNQVDYADVGNALNQRVLDSVLKGFEADSVKGAVVSLAGALAPGERMVVTPVRLARKDGR
jgi:predicted lipoprotein